MATFRPLERPSTFRKTAAAVWGPPNDPTIYGSMSVEMTAAQEFLARLRAATGEKLTVTHLVARALAVALGRHRSRISARPL